jgi:hypothetical protein
MSTKLINEVAKENNEFDRDRSTTESGFSITGRRRERGDIRTQSYHAEAFREVSIISRRQENLQQNDGEVYSKWTINDQLRLVALDALHAKEKEYHNLIPSADALEVIDIQRSQVSLEDIAAKVVFCSSISEEHNSFYETWQSYNNNTTSKTTPITLNHRHIKNVLSRLSIPEQGIDYIITIIIIIIIITASSTSSSSLLLLLLGLLWIQLQDLSTLNDITAIFDIQPVVKLAFTDLRARSTFVPIIPNESFVLTLAFCHLRTNGQHCGIAKLYIYVSKNIVITYESEVLSVSEDNDDIVSMDIFIYDQEIVNEVNKKLEFILPELCRYGTTFLLYNIALEGLRIQDQLVEFCSRSISFHKQLVDDVQNDINNSFIFRKVRVLESSLKLIKSQIVTSCDAITQCIGIGNDKYGTSMYSRDPYLKYVLDAFHYVEDTIILKVDEVHILHADMESLSQLVTARIALLLSLYFSLFVPLNFLTGIFGMNFQANTKSMYSIGILNDPDGVIYFWILCIVILLMTLSILVYCGLMKPLEAMKSYMITITNLIGKSYNHIKKEKEDAKLLKIKEKEQIKLLKIQLKEKDKELNKLLKIHEKEKEKEIENKKKVKGNKENVILNNVEYENVIISNLPYFQELETPNNIIANENFDPYTCVYRFKKGNKKRCQCENPIINQGYCKMHAK